MTCHRAGTGYGFAPAWIALPGFGAGIAAFFLPRHTPPAAGQPGAGL